MRNAWTLLALLSALAATGCGATRPGNVGLGTLSDCPRTPNCVSTHAGDETHTIKPLTFQGDASTAMDRLKRAIATMRRTKIIAEKPGYLYVEFTTGFWRFIDDVEFVFDDTTKTIHFRSASRIGQSDLGVNRKRMEDVRQRFDTTK
jgi:uncharacterized protein (DUF1499 family)